MFIALLVLALVGKFNLWPGRRSSLVSPTLHEQSQSPPEAPRKRKLFVLVHGFLPTLANFESIVAVLTKYGDVLEVKYPADRLSNADPDAVARGLSQTIEDELTKQPYAEIVLVAYSMGGLIARKAVLYAVGGTGISRNDEYRRSWGNRLQRIVILAGTNRGWDITGKKPLDMSPGTRSAFWLGSWFSRFAGAGKLILATETGAPFVANLRLEWLRWLRDDSAAATRIRVVQLQGDIDNIVSDEDNKNLQANAAFGKVAWLRVRGTDHRDILVIEDGTPA